MDLRRGCTEEKRRALRVVVREAVAATRNMVAVVSVVCWFGVGIGIRSGVGCVVVWIWFERLWWVGW